MIDARNLKYDYMRQYFVLPQSCFFIKHALQEILGRKNSLHVHICFAIMDKRYSMVGCFLRIFLIDDLILIEIHADLCSDRTDSCFITHENCINDALLMCFLYCFQHRLILSTGN